MLFFSMLFENVIFVYFIAALLPALVLLGYVRSKETIHRTPGPVIWFLLGCGALAAILTTFVEWIGTTVFNHVTTLSGTKYYLALGILVIGLIEEEIKFWMLKCKTWNYPFFTTKYDGIIYSVCIGLGFAIFENIKYVFAYGISVAPVRALTAIPGHLSFAVIMGYFYGRARYFEDVGCHGRAVTSQILGLVSAVLLHGLYDGMAMMNTDKSNFIFFIIMIVVYIIIFRLVKQEADTDTVI